MGEIKENNLTFKNDLERKIQEQNLKQDERNLLTQNRFSKLET